MPVPPRRRRVLSYPSGEAIRIRREHSRMNVQETEAPTVVVFSPAIQESVGNSLLHCFTEELNQLAYMPCTNCNRRVLTQDSLVSPCNSCQKNAVKFTSANNMDTDVQPPELLGLSPTEQMLIARVHPVLRVYKLKAAGGAGQYKYKGNVINVEQDIQPLATKLPLIPESLHIVLIRRAGMSDYEDFRVRRFKVQNALTWLIRNHIRFYSDLTIDHVALNSLPLDGNIASSLRFLNQAEIVDEVIEDDYVHSREWSANNSCRESKLCDS